MANTVLTSPQPSWLFSSVGPSGSGPGVAGAVEFAPGGLGPGSGSKSDVLDLGAGPRPSLFEWRARATVGTGTPTIGGTVELYLCTSDDGLNWDGNLGSGTAVITAAGKRRNLQYIGAVSIDEFGSGSGTRYINSGLCQVYARHLSVVWFNFTGIALSSTQSDQLFQLTPVPDQIQSS